VRVRRGRRGWAAGAAASGRSGRVWWRDLEMAADSRERGCERGEQGHGDGGERARRLRAGAGLAARFGDGGGQQRAGARERRVGLGRRQNRAPKIVDAYTSVLSSSIYIYIEST
jgi:hypothetical protein